MYESGGRLSSSAVAAAACTGQFRQCTYVFSSPHVPSPRTPIVSQHGSAMSPSAGTCQPRNPIAQQACLRRIAGGFDEQREMAQRFAVVGIEVQHLAIIARSLLVVAARIAHQPEKIERFGRRSGLSQFLVAADRGLYEPSLVRQLSCFRE